MLSSQAADPRDTSAGAVFPQTTFLFGQRTSNLGPSMNIQHITQVFNSGRHVNITSVKSSCFSLNNQNEISKKHKDPNTSVK